MSKKLEEFTNEELGKLVRHHLDLLKYYESEEPDNSMKKGILSFSCIVLALDHIKSTNTTKMEMRFENLSDCDKINHGNWKVILEQCDNGA